MCFHLVAARVLAGKTAVFKGHTMYISEPRQSSETHATQPAISKPQHSLPTVRVSNVPPTMSKEMLSMYFENSRRSHGGEIKDIRLVPGKKKAFITFKDPTGVFISCTVISSQCTLITSV